MDECIDLFGGLTIFSNLDAISKFWQIEIDEKDREETAFTSFHLLYQLVWTLFGFKNVPETFKRVMDGIMSPLKLQMAYVYLDDIVIIAEPGENKTKIYEQVLCLLDAAVVTLKFKRCIPFLGTVKYLRHMILPVGRKHPDLSRRSHK